MSVTVIPTVLAYTKEEFDERFKRVLPTADEIQVDLMDGKFVDTKSISLEELPDVRKHKKQFEAHLMVSDPETWIGPLVEKGYSRIIVHYETVRPQYLPQIAESIVRRGAKPVLALNPETAVDDVVPYAHNFDAVLFLGVHPGKNGAPYVAETPKRIRDFKGKVPDVTVQVDGGMTPATITDVVNAGATRVNSGSFVSGADDPEAALAQLRKAAGGKS